MASGSTNDGLLNLPYPLETDSVNVHGDIKKLAERLRIVLPPLGVPAFQIPVLNNSGVNIQAGDPVYITGYDNKTTVSRAISSTTDPILGLAKTFIANNAEGIVVVAGVLEDIDTFNYEDGDVLYVGLSGGLTKTQPESGAGAVGIVAYANGDNGIIIVEAKGNGTWGALKAGLA